MKEKPSTGMICSMEVWGYEAMPPRTVDNFILDLRKKAGRKIPQNPNIS